MKYTVIIDGKRLVVEAGSPRPPAIVAEIEGRKYVIDCKAVEPGVYWFNWQNRSIEISVTSNGHGYVVSMGRQRFAAEIEDERAAFRKITHSGHAGEIEVRAPMPGKVVKVLVEEGAEVKAGQGILVMEAMKMQNEIKSPKSGIVKRLGVQNGAAVNAGELLAVIE